MPIHCAVQSSGFFKPVSKRATSDQAPVLPCTPITLTAHQISAREGNAAASKTTCGPSANGSNPDFHQVPFPANTSARFFATMTSYPAAASPSISALGFQASIGCGSSLTLQPCWPSTRRSVIPAAVRGQMTAKSAAPTAMAHFGSGRVKRIKLVIDFTVSR